MIDGSAPEPAAADSAAEPTQTNGFVPPPLLNVVLHEPEIPNNTGNIGRTCVATHCALHLVHPLGFDTSERACRRAGLDYWPRLSPSEHASFDAYLSACFSAPAAATALAATTLASRSIDLQTPPHAAVDSASHRLWLFTTKRGPTIFDAPILPGDHLVFGKETRGLPETLLNRFEHRCLRFPMAEGERSLNLATAVCAAIYQALGRFAHHGWIGVSAEGRLRVGSGIGAEVGPHRQEPNGELRI